MAPAPKGNQFGAKAPGTQRTVKIEIPVTNAEKAALKKRFPKRGQLVAHLRTELGLEN